MTIAKPAITPMMAQFLEIKEDCKDSLLFYRMGDFYELFFDDAVLAAAALDIALTKRGKHLGEDIPMCGVPVHAAEGYLLTLIRKGFRVAVCEQLESPAEAKKRGAKSVVKRGVVRVVTPGTLTEDSLLHARSHNFLAAYAQVRDGGALAWVDISTGAFHVVDCPRPKLRPELARLAPSEVLLSDKLFDELESTVLEAGASPTALSGASFDSTNAQSALSKFFAVDSLDAFGNFSKAETGAMGALHTYLELTQRGNLPRLRTPVLEKSGLLVQIDAPTRQNLELTQSLSGGRAGSLLAEIDHTATSGGARLLNRRLSSPTQDITEISARADSVQRFVDDDPLRQVVFEDLRQVPDIERALSRLGLDRGGPRDLAAIRDGLGKAANIAKSLAEIPDIPKRICDLSAALVGFEALVERLQDALIAEPPLLSRDGGFIAAGYDEDLDAARKLRDEGRGVIAEMQSNYASLAEISALRIKHNNVLGYFIETTATHSEKMLSAPLNETFIHRQTTANAVRFTTVELSELETKILNSGAHALEIEKRLYSSLSEAISQAAGPIGSAASALAELDVYCSFAQLARTQDWVRPIVDNSAAFDISGGRHPVVEAALRRQDGSPFVANDCRLTKDGDHAAIKLLTGPNMAGKSTYLRQNCLIALLAQIGSFVPAQAAHIGVVSQIFSRVGAADDLARGRSTFMVEMVETAAILNQADEKALVILDEIGRGTATYDGLSIAWATFEHIHDCNKCRALFATHYHEMTQLADRLIGAQNSTVAVKEWEGEVIFLHEVRAGAADRSYGVQVAKLAGLPVSVTARAKTVLDALESGDRKGSVSPEKLIDDLPLFSAAPVEPTMPKTSSGFEELLSQTNPDELSPREALSLIYELKALSISESN